MTDFQNTAAGGIAGTTVTTGNSGGASGAAFTALYGTAPKFATVSSVPRYSFQADSVSTSIAEWAGLAAAAGSTLRDRFGIRITALPAATTKIAELRSDASAVIHVYLTSAGKLQVNDVAANAASTVTKVFSNALSVNTDYEVAVSGIAGTSTSNGTISFGYYLSSAPTSPVETVYTSSALNTGTANLTRTRHGKLTATAWTDTFYVWALHSTDTGSGLVGPLNQAPTVTVSDPQTVTVGTTVTMTGTASDTDGTIASRQWTCTGRPSGAAAPSIGGATTGTATFNTTGMAAGAYTFQFTATDNGGASGAASTTVTVSSAGTAPTAAATIAAPFALIDATSSTPGSGGTLVYAISPSTGTTQLTSGVFTVPLGRVAVTYTITATETTTGLASTTTVVAPPASQGAPSKVRVSGAWT